MRGQTYVSNYMRRQSWRQMGETFFQSTPVAKTFDCAHNILNTFPFVLQFSNGHALKIAVRPDEWHLYCFIDVRVLHKV